MADENKNNWHSRRHRTNDAHNKAKDAREDREMDKQVSAVSRQEEANKRTPQQQLQRLDDMLGVGAGAVKERAKLARRIASPKNEAKVEVVDDLVEKQVKAKKQQKKELSDKK